MKTHFKHGPAFKNIELLSSFIDLQNDLVLINQDLAEKSVGGTNKVAQVTESMLSAYIGLVNVAIGNQSAVWSEVSFLFKINHFIIFNNIFVSPKGHFVCAEVNTYTF